MSEAEKVQDLQIEIQKLLGEINRDMNELKSEVVSLNHILEGSSSLARNAEMVNERLMIAAKEAGISLEDLEMGASEGNSEQNAPEGSESEQNETENENGTQESTRDDEEITSPSNAAVLAAAADKLTRAVKRTLK